MQCTLCGGTVHTVQGCGPVLYGALLVSFVHISILHFSINCWEFFLALIFGLQSLCLLRLFPSVHTTAAVHGVLSATSPRDSWRWIVQPIRTHTINCWEFMAVVFLPPLGSSADRNCR